LEPQFESIWFGALESFGAVYFEAMDDAEIAEAAREYKDGLRLRPLCYLSVLPSIIHAARQCGYAIAVHGSISRDFDLVAIPWTDEAVEPFKLVEAVMVVVGGIIIEGQEGKNPTLKPHGRMAWSIHTGASMYIDLSVMPRSG
jgi:hypothetical protein